MLPNQRRPAFTVELFAPLGISRLMRSLLGLEAGQSLGSNVSMLFGKIDYQPPGNKPHLHDQTRRRELTRPPTRAASQVRASDRCLRSYLIRGGDVG